MKKWYLFLFLMVGIGLINACRKEFSFEGGNSTLAVFTLDGAPGGCMGASVAGSYTAGIALNPGNRVTIHVNVISAGAYNLRTTVVNDMTFTGSGTFIAAGPQAIVLTGSGTPVTEGNMNIPVNAGGFGCDFTINVANAQSASTFTLNCATAVVNGTYVAGTPLLVSNTVIISVNVTIAGSYTIGTTATNGMTFSASGIFTIPGNQTLTLNGSGTPSVSGTFTIPIAGGATSCNFLVTVSSAPSPPPVSNNWLFVENGITYQGSIVSAHLTTIGTSSTLFANGKTMTGDTVLAFDLTDVAAAIQVTGTYNTNNSGSGNKASFSFKDNIAGSTIYEAVAASPGVNLQFKIVSHDPLTRTIVGTFGGTALSGSNTVKAIHNGVFYITYQ